MNVEGLKRLLGLVPHPEGGWFTQTYKADESFANLPERYSGSRSTGTAIYYLLELGTFSEMHRLASDEIFHFYAGDPVEMLQLRPDGSAEVVLIGNDFERGMRPQVVVPKGIWQGSRLVAGGKFALLGCTVSPGFEFADYESGTREELSREYPMHAEMIAELTRR